MKNWIIISSSSKNIYDLHQFRIEGKTLVEIHLKYEKYLAMSTGYNKFYIFIMVNISMSEPAVLDWDRIVHKNVRSSDGQDAGNVDAIDGDL